MRPRESSPYLFVFDFDGTLSPIVPCRRSARLHPACRAILSALAGRARWRVAVLSSRSLADLAPRVGIRGVILGGGSGCEWLFPGSRMIGGREGERERLAAARDALLPLLIAEADLPGVVLEDKGWSAAIHYREADRAARRRLEERLALAEAGSGFRLLRGPDAYEIPFSPRATKKAGISGLLSLLRISPGSGRYSYAGDDENDAEALRWVVSHGGTGFSVGGRSYTPGCRPVGGPGELARAVASFSLGGAH